MWKNKVQKGMQKHHIVDAIANYDFQLNINSECHRLSELILTGDYRPSEPKRILVEKSRGLCRQLVIPTIDDSLVLQCLSDALYLDLKGKEPTEKAFFEPEDHSFQLQAGATFPKPDYGSFKAWLDFQRELLKFSKTYPYIVITDIANYYDGVSYSHLRNIISDLDIDVREAVLDMLIFVLNGLLWKPDYMPRVEIGLPQINTDAPRILAHCFLYELDRFLAQRCQGDFARFMDDIDIGVSSVAEAKAILRDLDLSLHTRQVRLNAGKTLILTRADAAKHYRTKDNAFLDALERHIERRIKAGIPLTRERKHLSSSLASWYHAGRFDNGNGEKILKRAIKIATKIGADLDDSLLYDILQRRPGVRENACKLVAQLPASTGRIFALHQIIASGSLVDDASFVYLATYITETVISPSMPELIAIRALVDEFPVETEFQLYGKILLASKYLSDRQLLQILSATQGRWRTDPWVARLVGACYPRFINSASMAGFRAMANNSGCVPSAQTFDFHERLHTEPAHFDKVYNYIKAGNPSKRIGTTHFRFLMAISAISNPAADPKKRNTIIANLGRAWADSFYRTIASLASGTTMPPAPSAPFPVP